jgi:hypothetical protein
VFDVDFDKGRAAWEMAGSVDFQADGIDATNGFAFGGTDTGSLDYALNRAIDSWYNDRCGGGGGSEAGGGGAGGAGALRPMNSCWGPLGSREGGGGSGWRP